MIDIKQPKVRYKKSRAEKISDYNLQRERISDNDIRIARALEDISLTLALILDEMRGIDNE